MFICNSNNQKIDLLLEKRTQGWGALRPGNLRLAVSVPSFAATSTSCRKHGGISPQRRLLILGREPVRLIGECYALIADVILEDGEIDQRIDDKDSAILNVVAHRMSNCRTKIQWAFRQSFSRGLKG
jgi:hypothetical protein